MRGSRASHSTLLLAESPPSRARGAPTGLTVFTVLCGVPAPRAHTGLLVGLDGLDEAGADTAWHPQGGGCGQIGPVQSQTVMQRQIDQIQPSLEADPLRSAAVCASYSHRQRLGEPVVQDRPASHKGPSPSGLLLPPHRSDRHIRQVGGEHLLVDLTNIRTRRRRFSQAHASSPCSPSAARYSLTTRGSEIGRAHV